MKRSLKIYGFLVIILSCMIIAGCGGGGGNSNRGASITATASDPLGSEITNVTPPAPNNNNGGGVTPDNTGTGNATQSIIVDVTTSPVVTPPASSSGSGTTTPVVAPKTTGNLVILIDQDGWKVPGVTATINGVVARTEGATAPYQLIDLPAGSIINSINGGGKPNITSLDPSWNYSCDDDGNGNVITAGKNLIWVCHYGKISSASKNVGRKSARSAKSTTTPIPAYYWPDYIDETKIPKEYTTDSLYSGEYAIIHYPGGIQMGGIHYISPWDAMLNKTGYVTGSYSDPTLCEPDVPKDINNISIVAPTQISANAHVSADITGYYNICPPNTAPYSGQAQTNCQMIVADENCSRSFGVKWRISPTPPNQAIPKSITFKICKAGTYANGNCTDAQSGNDSSFTNIEIYAFVNTKLSSKMSFNLFGLECGGKNTCQMEDGAKNQGFAVWRFDLVP